ncbi:MAG: hypothetical protein QM711_04925 [Micropruina sp.]|uniref:hypothetical protein n=1 Tax=Micropruina sp. TaxID=2737536 RepID=UPI0039E5E903
MSRSLYYYIAIFCITICSAFAPLFLLSNPFAIPFQPKAEISNQDYLDIQEQFKNVNIHPLLRSLYPSDQGYTIYEDFCGRSSKGISQILIDEEKGLFPRHDLVKIGEGSDCCLVCCAPYDGVRDVLLDQIVKEVANTGFNGYFYYRKGGFPNPTGKEIQYAGVPYCFKIFMMQEAHQLGFDKVLWIDSACLPLRDPTPLFDWLDYRGALLNGWTSPPWLWRYILPSTRQLLIDLTGNDVLTSSYLHTRIFGLRMDSELAKKLVEEYYSFVEMGTPFLSCYPEEFVLTALLAKPEYTCWGFYPYHVLLVSEEGDDLQEITQFGRNNGYFFYQLRH